MTVPQSDDDILTEARTRFRECEDDESQCRTRYRDDVKFGEADSDNGYQWPDAQRKTRELDARPCLTINKTRQHCLQILNDARQNKPQIRVSPVGDGATKDAAEVFEGVIRHIEYISQAQAAYDTASYHQIFGGWGYIRVLRDYAGDDSFDQELFIRRVGDPLSVYLDPHIQQYDGSDARWGFVFKDQPRADFEAEYPAMKDKVSSHGSFAETDYRSQWCQKDHVRVAEYYRRVRTLDTLIALPQGVTMPDGRTTALKSELPEEVADTLKGQPSREVERWQVEWFLIAGDRIVDRRDEPGRYIPIVRVIGEETRIDGKLDRKGHVRALKDAQRMLNYWRSAAVEHVALQGKTPWLVDERAIEGHEHLYETANTVNHAYLPYRSWDTEAGQAIAPPRRAEGPTMAQAFIAGSTMAEEDLRLASGQYQAEMGAPGNERSGVAINARQRQADNSTYHYVDHLAGGIRFLGRILIDQIPFVYDTPRVLRILGEDGTEEHVKLDPTAEKPVQDWQDDPNDITPETVARVFNPKIGKYAVQADIGPAFATRRQEAFNAISQILKQAPDLVKVAGDLLFRSGDFPMADKIAERLERTVPANIKGDGPPPEVEQAQQHIQQLQGVIQQGAAQIADLKRQLAQRDAGQAEDAAANRAKTGIGIYDAETRRIAALAKGLDPQSQLLLVQQLVGDVMSDGPLHPGAPMLPSPQPMPPAPPALPPGGPPPGAPLQ